MKKIIFILAIFFSTDILAQQPLPPDKIYGQLFTDVQMSKIFPDGKTFVDCIPKRNPKTLVAEGVSKLSSTNSFNEKRIAGLFLIFK